MNLSFSMKIFFIAGSSNHAVAAVLAEPIKIKKKIIDISLKYFFIWVLKILFAISIFFTFYFPAIVISSIKTVGALVE